MAGTLATSRYPPRATDDRGRCDAHARASRAPAVPLLRGLRGRAPLPGLAAARLVRLRARAAPAGTRIPTTGEYRVGSSSSAACGRLPRASRSTPPPARVRLLRGGEPPSVAPAGDPRTPSGFAGLGSADGFGSSDGMSSRDGLPRPPLVRSRRRRLGALRLVARLRSGVLDRRRRPRAPRSVGLGLRAASASGVGSALGVLGPRLSSFGFLALLRLGLRAGLLGTAALDLGAGRRCGRARSRRCGRSSGSGWPAGRSWPSRRRGGPWGARWGSPCRAPARRPARRAPPPTARRGRRR